MNPPKRSRFAKTVSHVDALRSHPRVTVTAVPTDGTDGSGDTSVSVVPETDRIVRRSPLMVTQLPATAYVEDAESTTEDAVEPVATVRESVSGVAPHAVE